MNGAERVCRPCRFLQQLKAASGGPKPARKWCSNSSISSGCSSAAAKVGIARASALTASCFGDFVDKLSVCLSFFLFWCHRDLQRAERGESWGGEWHRGGEGERERGGLDCLTGRYFVVEARLGGARMLFLLKRGIMMGSLFLRGWVSCWHTLYAPDWNCCLRHIL